MCAHPSCESWDEQHTTDQSDDSLNQSNMLYSIPSKKYIYQTEMLIHLKWLIGIRRKCHKHDFTVSIGKWNVKNVLLLYTIDTLKAFRFQFVVNCCNQRCMLPNVLVIDLKYARMCFVCVSQSWLFDWSIRNKRSESNLFFIDEKPWRSFIYIGIFPINSFDFQVKCIKLSKADFCLLQ